MSQSVRNGIPLLWWLEYPELFCDAIFHTIPLPYYYYHDDNNHIVFSIVKHINYGESVTMIFIECISLFTELIIIFTTTTITRLLYIFVNLMTILNIKKWADYTDGWWFRWLGWWEDP